MFSSAVIFLSHNPIPTSRSYSLFFFSFFSFYSFYSPPINVVLFFFLLNSIFFLRILLIFHLLVVLKILTFWVDECSKLGWVRHANRLTNLPIFCLFKKRICLNLFLSWKFKDSLLINKIFKKIYIYIYLGTRCLWGFKFGNSSFSKKKKRFGNSCETVSY